MPDEANIDPLDYWQDLLPPGGAVGPISENTFIARLPNGQGLLLPIRRPPSRPDNGLASLIINQASLAVEKTLCSALADRLADERPDIIVAVPTLGLIAGRGVAGALGHPRYAPLGTSRKFWYDEALSVPLRSITSPDQAKRLYLDPRLLPLLKDKRIALVDDVVSSGQSMIAALNLMTSLNLNVAVIGALMRQTNVWRERIDESSPQVSERVLGVFDTPLLKWSPDGWTTA
ncbi:MAG: phosphoribosyltransferase [Pseudomonadota bacterium]